MQTKTEKSWVSWAAGNSRCPGSLLPSPGLAQSTKEVFSKLPLASFWVLWKLYQRVLCGIQTILNKGSVIYCQGARYSKEKENSYNFFFYGPKVSYKLMKAKSLNCVVPLSP